MGSGPFCPPISGTGLGADVGASGDFCIAGLGVSDIDIFMNTTPNTSATARQCAVELLAQVLEQKRPFDEAAARHRELGTLSDRDRNFTRLLVMTVLRRLGQIDALLTRMLQKPLQGKTQDVMHILRLGTAQLIWLGTPAHAAVHTMVETTNALGHEAMKGLVNAVLKRIAAEGSAIIATQDEAALNTPSWLWHAWRKTYGEAAVRAIAATHLVEPPLDITVKEDAEGWARKLGGEVLSTGSVRLHKTGRVEALTGYNDGAWWVQDAAAALPVKLLGDVRGKTVLDLCAAPGGKTAQLVTCGALVTSVDKSARRLKTLADNLQRLQLTAELIEADMLRWKPVAAYDAILLDAPCSATGTLRRHPEIAWCRTSEDSEELAELQKRLLRRAASWLKPGGKLVYCVCSLQPEEGEQQEMPSQLKPVSSVQSWPKELYPFLTQLNAIRTHPGLWADKGGIDGFYAILCEAVK